MSRRLLSTLRVRLLLLVLLAVVPALGLVLYSAVEQRRLRAEEAQASARRLARIVRHDYSRTIQEAHGLLEGLASLPDVRGADPAACRRTLAAMLAGYPRYFNFGALTPDGTLLCSAQDVPPGTKLSDGLAVALRESVRTGDFASSGFTTGRVSRKPIVMFTHPSAGPDGSAEVVAFASLKLEWLNELAAGAWLLRSSTLSVLDPAGNILVRYPDAARWVGHRVADRAGVGRVIGGDSEFAFTAPDLDGVERIFASTPLTAPDGRVYGQVVVGVPTRVAYASAYRSLVRNLTWLGLIGALALAAAWLGGEVFVVRRLEALLAATRRLAEGDRGARSGIADGEGEIAQLARAFDEMAERLQTRQEEAERAAESLRRQALVFASVTDGVLVTDAEGRIIDWNAGAERLFGYTRDEVLGRSPAMFHHPSVGLALEESIIEGLRRDGRWEGEIPFLHRDGSEGIADAAVVVQYDPAGRPIAHIGVNRDVTARRRAERALHATNARLSYLLTSTPAAIYSAGVSGDSAVTFVSQNVLQQTGYPAERFVSDPAFWRDNLHPDDRESVLREFGTVVERGGQVIEYRFRHRDGHYLWMHDEVTVIRGADGEPQELVGYWIDITDRKRAEEALAQSQAELRQAQKMEAVGRLAGGVAHDFNNLLTAIRGNTELALLDLPPFSSVRGELEQIRHSAETAAALTRQLLAFSRKQMAEPVVLDLDAVVTSTAQLLRRLLGPEVELVTRPASAPALVRADSGQVEQILLNLAINARDAMPGGGRLTIRTEPLSAPPPPAGATQLPAGEYVHLSVADSGIGIDPSVQPHLFEPFFTTKEQGKGTGLGLFTVYGIVKQSGGHVWVESAPGEGTVFHICLPRVPAESAARDDGAAGARAPEPGSETILLVDDEPSVRMVAARILQRSGYRVLEASGCEEALRLAREHPGPIHLLLTDILMPRMSGSELAGRIAALRPETRIVYMSGFTDDVALPEDPRGHRHPFVHKPFSLDVLTHTVRTALDAA